MKERIKAVRKALNLTQQSMADALGLKQNTIATYEMGRFQPSDRTIADICRTYNVNEVWLRTGVGEMFTTRTREDEIAAYMGRLLGGKCSELENVILYMMAHTTVDQWDELTAKVLEAAAQYKEKPDQD